MANIGNRLKGIFIVQEDEPVAQPTAKKEAVPNAVVTQTPQQSPAEDAKLLEALSLALKEKALSEYDFMKFIDSQQALAAVISDEATRFKAAFATVKNTGVTKDRLLETAKHYLAVLDAEKSSFMSGIDASFKDKVGTNLKKIEDFDLLIKSKEAEIKRILEELDTDKKSRDTLSGQTQEWQTKIERAKTSFEQADAKMRGQIEADIQKVTTYIT